MSREITRRAAMTGLALPLFPGFALGDGPTPPPAPPASLEPPAIGQLPPLPVAIYDADGAFFGMTNLDDPRDSYCRHYNELNEGLRTAKPLVPAGETRSYTKQPDGTTRIEHFDAGDTEAWHVEMRDDQGFRIFARYGKRKAADEMAADLGPFLARVTGPHAR